jgi:hypothetical protein
VMVAVVTRDSVVIASGVRDIWKIGSGQDGFGARILRGRTSASRAGGKAERSFLLISGMRINLLKLLHHFASGEFHCGSKHASLMPDES